MRDDRRRSHAGDTEPVADHRERLAPGRAVTVKRAGSASLRRKVSCVKCGRGRSQSVLPARRAVRVTADGEGYAYGYGRYLNDLYLVEGLRF